MRRWNKKTLTHHNSAFYLWLTFSTNDSLFSIFYNTLFDRRREQRTDLNSQCVLYVVSRMRPNLLFVCVCVRVRLASISWHRQHHLFHEIFTTCFWSMLRSERTSISFMIFIIWHFMKIMGWILLSLSPSQNTHLPFHIFFISTPGLNLLFALTLVNFLHYIKMNFNHIKILSNWKSQNCSNQYANKGD